MKKCSAPSKVTATIYKYTHHMAGLSEDYETQPAYEVGTHAFLEFKNIRHGKKLTPTRFSFLQFPVLSGLACTEWCGNRSAILWRVFLHQHHGILLWTKPAPGTLKSDNFPSLIWQNVAEGSLFSFLANTENRATRNCTDTLYTRLLPRSFHSVVNAPTSNYRLNIASRCGCLSVLAQV